MNFNEVKKKVICRFPLKIGKGIVLEYRLETGETLVFYRDADVFQGNLLLNDVVVLSGWEEIEGNTTPFWRFDENRLFLS